MSFQIPQKAKALILLEETMIDLYKVTPALESPVKQRIFRNAVVTMFIKGHIGSDFKMRLHVHDDASGSNILFSSNEINNLDIERTGDHYCELRFDFPTLGNLMSCGKPHLLKLEIYDGYVQDPANYVALIMDTLGNQNFLGSQGYDIADAPDLGVICSFFFETPNASTEDFFMCRIQGAKLINGLGPSETAYDLGTKWYYGVRIQAGLVIDSFKIRSAITLVTQTLVNAGQVFTPDPLNYNTHINQYYYNKKTGDLIFYTNMQLNTNQYAIMEYLLFFTDTRGKYAPTDMASFGNSVVYWEPRLSPDISFDFSQQNNLQGILSISSSPVSLKNQDGYLNGFFSTSDCFSNREVKIWRCKGSVENNSFEFLGVIRSANLSDTECRFEIADPLAKLDNTFSDLLPLRYGNTAYTLRDIDRVKIIPRVYGKISRFSSGLFPTGLSLGVNRMMPENAITATCISYNPASKTTATNRTWSVGFGPASAAVMSRDVTAVATVTVGTFTGSKFTINNSLGPVSEWLPIGSTVMNNGKYGVVYDSNATEAYIYPQNASFSAAFDIFRHKVISVVVVKDGVNFWLNGGEHFTCQIGASGDLQIVFVNGFESLTSAGMGGVPLDPDEDEIFVVMMNDEADAKASSIVKDLLLKAGLAVSGSFAPPQTPAWNAWSDIELSLTLDGEMPKYRDLVESCLRSAMSFIYFDTNGAIRYKAFMHPMHSPFNIDLTENQSGFDASDAITQKNSKEFSVKFDLWDLYAGVIFNFTQCRPNRDSLEFSTSMAKDFYKTQNLFQVETIIDPTRIAASAFYFDYARLVTGRSAIFSITALAEQMGLYIGDDIVLKRKNIIDGQTELTLRVVSKNKKQSGASLTLMDLKNFPGL